MEVRSRPRHDGASAHVPLGELLGDVAGHAQGIVRTEVRLALAQARDEVSAGARRVTFLGGAAVFALLGCVMLLIAAVLALSTVMVAWMAVLMTAAVAFLAAAVFLGLAGRTTADSSA